MKKISIIDLANLNATSKELSQIRLNLSRKYKDKYVFQNYEESKAKIDTYFNGLTNFIFKTSQLSKIVKCVYILLHATFYADILIVKGVKTWLYFPILKLFFRKKIILLINNFDVKISQSKNIYTIFFEFKKYVAFNFSHRIITSQQFIQDYFKAKYNLNVDLIEQGGDHVNHIESTSLDHSRYPFLKYMYAVSYFNDELNNHIEIVLDSFKRCKKKYIVIIGDWNKTNRGIYLKNKYAGYSNIYMIYPYTLEMKMDLIVSNSILYIHSSSLANDSLPLIEAMSLKLPVLAFESNDNIHLTEGKASYFKNRIDVNYFLDTLNMEKLRKNSFEMSDIALKRFAWSNIACKYEIVIDKLLYLNNRKSLLFYFRNFHNAFFQNKALYLKPRLAIFKTILNFFL